jgi:hypothetical protein
MQTIKKAYTYLVCEKIPHGLPKGDKTISIDEMNFAYNFEF